MNVPPFFSLKIHSTKSTVFHPLPFWYQSFFVFVFFMRLKKSICFLVDWTQWHFRNWMDRISLLCKNLAFEEKNWGKVNLRERFSLFFWLIQYWGLPWWWPNISEHLPTFWNSLTARVQILKPKNPDCFTSVSKPGKSSSQAKVIGEAFGSSVEEADPWHPRCGGEVLWLAKVLSSPRMALWHHPRDHGCLVVNIAACSFLIKLACVYSVICKRKACPICTLKPWNPANSQAQIEH
jgi:hypothetical protein